MRGSIGKGDSAAGPAEKSRDAHGNQDKRQRAQSDVGDRLARLALRRECPDHPANQVSDAIRDLRHREHP
jgi:hypothetical protein